MIVVEGPDGSGKTTLIKAMQATMDVALQPRVVGSDTVAMTDLKIWVEVEARRQVWHRVPVPLYDRHRLISEFIYGPLMGRSPEPGFDDFGWVMRHIGHFYLKRPLLIYCMPPLEEGVRNCSKEETDNAAVEHKTEAIWIAYSRLAANDALYHGALIWDYTQGTTSMFL